MEVDGREKEKVTAELMDALLLLLLLLLSLLLSLLLLLMVVVLVDARLPLLIADIEDDKKGEVER